MSKVRFLKFKVVNDETSASAKVSYSLDNRVDGRKCVTIYAKEYGRQLSKVFESEHVTNLSDSMTDFFDKDTVRLFEDNPLYKEARECVERFNREFDEKYAKKREKKAKQIHPEVSAEDVEVAVVYINLMKRLGCKQIVI